MLWKSSQICDHSIHRSTIGVREIRDPTRANLKIYQIRTQQGNVWLNMFKRYFLQYEALHEKSLFHVSYLFLHIIKWYSIDYLLNAGEASWNTWKILVIIWNLHARCFEKKLKKWIILVYCATRDRKRIISWHSSRFRDNSALRRHRVTDDVLSHERTMTNQRRIPRRANRLPGGSPTREAFG